MAPLTGMEGILSRRSTHQVDSLLWVRGTKCFRGDAGKPFTRFGKPGSASKPKRTRWLILATLNPTGGPPRVAIGAVVGLKKVPHKERKRVPEERSRPAQTTPVLNSL